MGVLGEEEKINSRGKKTVLGNLRKKHDLTLRRAELAALNVFLQKTFSKFAYTYAARQPTIVFQ